MGIFANSGIAVFAGGCFWCTEAVFKALKGVGSAVPVYTGGHIKNPTYDQVATGKTGHAEAVKIEFDPNVISYRDLLNVFFHTHDPTSLNKQGGDIGTEYRSVIFFANPEQEKEARTIMRELVESSAYDKPIATEIAPLGEIFPAEDYHREYYETHRGDPYCELVIAPKLERLQKRFEELLKG